MDTDKGKFLYSGLRWLYEMELVNDPQLINNLKLNVFSISSHIKEVELLFSYQHRQLLVFIDVSWIGRNFLKTRILAAVEDRVHTLLPNFRLRVVTERAILDLALAKVKAAMTGGKSNEEVADDPKSDDSKPDAGG